MIQNHTTNKATNIQVKVMTAKELKLQREYQKLLTEHDSGHRRLKWVKQRMAEIRRQINVVDIIVDDRPDEVALKVN